ncbi:MAG: hypothetical protein ACI9W2_002747 [Gammaproteobacteria bacterium]|jgi:hypothetical protein
MVARLAEQDLGNVVECDHLASISAGYFMCVLAAWVGYLAGVGLQPGHSFIA